MYTHHTPPLIVAYVVFVSPKLLPHPPFPPPELTLLGRTPPPPLPYEAILSSLGFFDEFT